MLEKMIKFSVPFGSLNESGRWEVVWQPVDSNKMKYGCFKVIGKTLNFTVSEDGVLQVLLTIYKSASLAIYKVHTQGAYDTMIQYHCP